MTDQTSTGEELDPLARYLLRAFAEGPIGMCLMYADGRYGQVNPALCEILGRGREELIGSLWQDSVHPADRESAERWLAETRERGSGAARTDELRYCRSDGAVVYALKTCTSVADADGVTRWFICQILDVSERHRYADELEHLALHDHLTGLPNRALFDDRLHQALWRQRRTGETVAVQFLDLDGFKRVNDGLGHGAGDIVLTQTARRLEEVMRDGDTVCRFGGDEFVVLCELLHTETGAETALCIAERMIDVIGGAPFVLGEASVVLTASVGVALAPPAADVPAQRLVAEADAAMYRAKARGGATAELARCETEVVTHRLALENDLRDALDGAEGLWLAYQPIVDLDGGEVVGLEALLRWDRPRHGPVSPSEIIPIAEDAGLIVRLGDWVIDRAISDLAGYGREGAPYVAINLAARQFTSETLVDHLAGQLAEFRMDPARISLEITEGVAMGEPEMALATMHALKEVGVRLAIDDFGTGFSSLGYLKRFPADTLKIDRMFVSDVAAPSEDRAIVEAVLSLGASLGLDVIAEGVETSEQRDALARMRCPRAQGFLFAAPSPLAELAVRG